MNQAISDKRLRLLERTFAAALASSGIMTISAAALQVDALRYVMMAVGVALMASPFFGVPKRIVNYVAARRGSSYVGFFVIFLPIALVLTTFLLGAFLWLGTSSGILDAEDYFIPIAGVIIAILINIAILVYNVVEIRGTG